MVPTGTKAGSGFSDRSDLYLLYLVKLTNAFQFVTYCIVEWFSLILFFFKLIVNGLFRNCYLYMESSLDSAELILWSF